MGCVGATGKQQQNNNPNGKRQQANTESVATSALAVPLHQQIDEQI
jgi:hypothetical protein